MRKVKGSNYSKAIRKIRLDRDINQDEMSEVMCYGRVTVSLIESGKKRHNTKFVFDIVRSLNLLDREFKDLVKSLCRDYDITPCDSLTDTFIKVCYKLDDCPEVTNRELYLNNDILVKYADKTIPNDHRISYLISKFLDVVNMSECDFNSIVEIFEKVKDK